MVNMVLLLMLTVQLLPLSGKGSYFCTSKFTFLLVYPSSERRKQELSLLAYRYTACHACRSLILTEYSNVAREYVVHSVAHRLLPRNLNNSAHRTLTMCMRTSLLCRKLKLDFLSKKTRLQFLANLPSPLAEVRPLRSITCAVPYALQVSHVALQSMLFFSPESTLTFLREHPYLLNARTFL